MKYKFYDLFFSTPNFKNFPEGSQILLLADPSTKEYLEHPYYSDIDYFGRLVAGSPVSSHNGGVFRVPVPVPILFDWPSWLKAKWIFKSKAGDWYGSVYEEPIIVNKKYWSCSNYFKIPLEILDINLPDVEWRESKFRNPNL